MLGMPNPTPYDLKFRAFGIPARVSPWFWLGAVMIGPKEPKLALIFIPCALFSILVHEYGHGLMYRLFGFRSEIALFALGGLCAAESPRQTPGQKLAILAMGPGAQLILLGLVVVFGHVVLGLPWVVFPELGLRVIGIELDLGTGIPSDPLVTGEAYKLSSEIFLDLFIINWLWPLLNLLPIWPLDGGQMVHVVLTRAKGNQGARWTHIVSMVVSGLLCFYVLRQVVDSQGEDGLLRVLFFGWFALMNFQMLQAYHQRFQASPYEDETDWWRH